MGDVLVRQEGVCGRITLNRPQAINALTLEMVAEMYRTLKAWAGDPEIEFLLVDGAGDRGLCAGGDIRALYDYAVSGDFASAAAFFQEEYRLNFFISRYPKPYIVLMDGIVMGGGVGISAHGSRRIVTERSMLAMPETSIGFIPDVGGTFLLGRAPSEFGTHLALTGGRIGAADAIACGLADMYLASDRAPALVDALIACDSQATMRACLQTFAAAPPAGVYESQRRWIEECFAGGSVEEILAALHDRPEREATAAAQAIAKNSPTSLKVTLRALRRGREYADLGRCLQQEFSIAMMCVREGDFVEGVRAAVVDKDRRPRWRPDRLEDVTEGQVDSFFAGPHLSRDAVTEQHG